MKVLIADIPEVNARRRALRQAITWLHQRADSMNDPSARGVLNSAAFDMGHALKTFGPIEWSKPVMDAVLEMGRERL